MTIVFSGSPVANVELADSFNTWRLTTNKILSDAASLTSNNSMAGSLSVTGAVSLANTLSVTGLTTLSTLNVTGTATLPTMSSANVANTLSVTGAATLSNTISVTGSATFGNTVTIPTLVITRGTSQKVKVVGSVSSDTNLDLDEANIFDVTLGANNIALSFTNPPVSGFAAGVTLILRQDAVGTRFATFTNAVYTDGIAPLLTTNANAIDVLSFFTVDGGTSYFGSQTMAGVS